MPVHQPQLLARQLPGENLTIADADGRLEFCELGVDVGQMVMLIVDEIQADDDPVKHGIWVKQRPQFFRGFPRHCDGCIKVSHRKFFGGAWVGQCNEN